MDWAGAMGAMQRLSERFEVSGCALVEPSSGLVWHACGRTEQPAAIWEAAVDYWRLHDRSQAVFTAVGALGAIVLYHRAGALAVLPCSAEPRLHMVCLAEHGRMDWMAWQHEVRELGRLLDGRT